MDRVKFKEIISCLSAEKLVFCDEMGVDDNISPLYGWSARGNRSYGAVNGYRKERVNILAGYQKGSTKLIAPIEYVGNTDTRIFNLWIKDHLCPQLIKGQYVILDNVSFHKSPKVREYIENIGCFLLYLPAYSPDLNPIEHCWANFKNCLRRIIDEFSDFKDAITKAMELTFSG